MRWVRMGAVAIVLASCGGDARAPSTAAPTAAVGVGEWVAVFGVGSPDDLEPVGEELMQRAPDNVSVSPIGCWSGLARAVGAADAEYAAALVAPTRAELDDAVAAVDRDPSHVGEYPNACVE